LQEHQKRIKETSIMCYKTVKKEL